MDETTTLWNKKLRDITVGDSAKVTALTPIITIVASAVATAAVTGLQITWKKFRTRKDDQTIEPSE